VRELTGAATCAPLVIHGCRRARSSGFHWRHDWRREAFETQRVIFDGAREVDMAPKYSA
jgi:hypothetical protein